LQVPRGRKALQYVDDRTCRKGKQAKTTSEAVSVFYGHVHACAAFGAAFPESGNRARPADLLQAAARRPEGQALPAPAITCAMTEGTRDDALRALQTRPCGPPHRGAPTVRFQSAWKFADIFPKPRTEPCTAFEHMGADRHLGAPGKQAF